MRDCPPLCAAPRAFGHRRRAALSAGAHRAADAELLSEFWRALCLPLLCAFWGRGGGTFWPRWIIAAGGETRGADVAIVASASWRGSQHKGIFKINTCDAGEQRNAFKLRLPPVNKGDSIVRVTTF